jgi:hypothetical protein
VESGREAHTESDREREIEDDMGREQIGHNRIVREG